MADKSVEIEVMARELRSIRNSVEELTLQVRGETWGMRVRSDINYVQQAIRAIPMSARICFVLGVLLLSTAAFVDAEKRKLFLNIGGNLLLIAIAFMGAEI